MICNVCGKPHPCAHSSRRALRIEIEDLDQPCQDEGGLTTSTARADNGARALESISLAELAAEVRARSDQRNWREEVALRVGRHRARRNSASSGSMQLQFPEEEALALDPPPLERGGLSSATRALAGSSNARESRVLQDHAITTAPEHADEDSGREAQAAGGENIPVIRQKTRKIIRFPAYAVPLESPAPRITEIELEEPAVSAGVPDTEKTREPQQMELLPSFANIRLEEQLPEDAAQAGSDLELPLRPAALLHRLGAAVLDGMIMSAALAIFVFTLSKVSPALLSGRTMLLAVFASGAIFWLVFQYLFLVYGRATPGMRAARLRLLAFEGSAASRYARRSRALALTLSAISVGMGFAWALVDEDMLGWHDRISRTYLKSGDRLIQ